MPRRSILSFGGGLPANPSISGALTVGGQILAADGTQLLPGYAFASDPDTGIWRVSAGRIGFSSNGSLIADISDTTGGKLILASAAQLNWANEVILARDAANVLAMRNGTNAQTQRWSETYTDINNRAGISLSAAAGGPYVITPEAVGSGVLRGLQLAATSGLIGFMGATPVVRQTDGAAITNNVTVGGTTNQLDDFTNLAVYATDAAAIRNDIYQLGRKLKIVDDALRLYGLLT